MKRSRLCLALLLALIGFAAWAEPAPPNDDHWLQHMKQQLDLTEQQLGELKKIHEELKPERDALREQHKTLHEKMAERVKATLTEAQQKKFQEMHEQRPGSGMHGAGPGMGCDAAKQGRRGMRGKAAASAAGGDADKP